MWQVQLKPFIKNSFQCRQIEQLHKKKGTAEQKQKNDRKAERFLQEIQFIKKSKKSEVAKFSLSNVEKSAEDDVINPDGRRDIL